MSAITWDAAADRKYEVGVDHGVIYPQNDNGTYGKGVAWNGLVSINEAPSGAEPTKLYADNIQYLNMYSAEEFGLTLEAYTWPEEFDECNGSAVIAVGALAQQQVRKSFGLCYRTKIGNSIKGDAYGYKLHIVYGCKASPSEATYETINDSPDAITFSWELTTTPVTFDDDFKATAHIIIDSTKISDNTKLEALEALLYGTDPAEGQTSGGTDAQLPSIATIISTLGVAS